MISTSNFFWSVEGTSVFGALKKKFQSKSIFRRENTKIAMSAIYAKRFEAVFLCTHPKRPKMNYLVAAKYIKKSVSFVKKWVQRFKVSKTVDDLPNRGSVGKVTKKDKSESWLCFRAALACPYVKDTRWLKSIRKLYYRLPNNILSKKTRPASCKKIMIPNTGAGSVLNGNGKNALWHLIDLRNRLMQILSKTSGPTSSRSSVENMFTLWSSSPDKFDSFGRRFPSNTPKI